MARRKQGQLIAIEVEILLESLRLATSGQLEFHGFGIAKELRNGDSSQGLIGHGTLYKALGRLETAGLLQSKWEDPNAAAEQKRPRRRLYSITSDGRLAAASAIEARRVAKPPDWYPGVEPA